MPKRAIVGVRASPRGLSRAMVVIGPLAFPAAIGRGGISSRKREGDGATPRAVMRVEFGYFRRDRTLLVPTTLAMRAIRASDGWCDAPAHPRYNQPVKRPFAASHENMMRADRLYDVCIVLDWNRRVRCRNAGSAIFLHIARPGFEPTEGCIAVAPVAMRRILPLLARGSVVRVV